MESTAARSTTTTTPTPETAVLWFPDSGHAELEVNRKMYNLFLGNADFVRDEPEQRDRAYKGRGAKYYRFALALSPAEHLAIKNAVTGKTPKVPFGDCSCAVARLLNEKANLRLSNIASLSPALLATQLHGHSAVSSIEYIAKRQIVNVAAGGAQFNADRTWGIFAEVRQAMKWTLGLSLVAAVTLFPTWLVVETLYQARYPGI